MIPDDDEDEKRSLNKWDLLVKGVAAIMVSGAITFYGVRSEQNQFETAERNRRSQVLVETISSREMAAADMRAKMFDTLVQHYFRDREDDATKVVILEMIGHNFEDDLNLKPLFLRLDQELTAKGSEQREVLREAARGIARSEVAQIIGAGGDSCTLELSVGETQVAECIAPLPLTLREVSEGQLVVSTGPGDRGLMDVTWYDLPLVNNRYMGELRYALVLLEADPESGRAKLQAVRLPSTFYDVENRLRVDQLISDLTMKEF